MRIIVTILIICFPVLTNAQSREWIKNVSASATVWETSEDANNNIYMLCGYTDSIKNNGSVFYAGNFGSHFIAKYKSNGKLVWLKDLGSNYYTHYKNLRVTPSGQIYLSKDNRYGKIILSKFSPLGELEWSKNYGGSIYDNCNDLQLDARGNVYMKGNFWYAASYGDISVSGKGNCTFLAKLDASGSVEWVKTSPEK